MEKAVLLSLHQEWWELMKTQEKTLEVRRTRPKNVELPVRVIVYVTSPVCAIAGEFLCPHFVMTDRVAGLQRRSRVPLENLEQYAAGGPVYGWVVHDVAAYPKLLPMSSLGLDKPPQSWCYVNVEELWP